MPVRVLNQNRSCVDATATLIDRSTTEGVPRTERLDRAGIGQGGQNVSCRRPIPPRNSLQPERAALRFRLLDRLGPFRFNELGPSEFDSDHPGELDSGGVLLFSETSPDRAGIAAIATQIIFSQPVRVFALEVDHEMKIEIQSINGDRREGEHRRPSV